MHEIHVRTPSAIALVDITAEVQRVVRESGTQTGICHLFVPHTTAGLIVNENWDPSVREDIIHALNKLIPMRDNYRHREGNAAAHIKATLVGNSQALLIENGQVRLGTWQGIYLAEFDGPRHRTVWLHIV